MDPEAGCGKAEALRARHCSPAMGAGAAAAAVAAEAHVEEHKRKNVAKGKQWMTLNEN